MFGQHLAEELGDLGADPRPLEFGQRRDQADPAELAIRIRHTTAGSDDGSVDLDNGLVRAVYQVTGKDYPAAASRAIAVFFQAQVSAGVEPTMRILRITTAAI